MTRERVKGGEKNENSGKRWTEPELQQVLDLFLHDTTLKIHETNPSIIALALKINRTVRSIEAQLLMFRNLGKHGDYSYGNMNKLCKKLWIQHLQSVKSV
ncbi:hypothetical protein GWC95_01010 [Sediminibacterium roseum]|uniref:Uncharacterized protein n=1 Tax=Sediminibacterium roseum TaxID=1978412 RepID=A0ABW9ZN29_9BACT|nr:hypothetical protein [Sediminibacterium roseum]NCI48481.1 hypothetical protein [Sediminibacterium roseum]